MHPHCNYNAVILLYVIFVMFQGATFVEIIALLMMRDFVQRLCSVSASQELDLNIKCAVFFFG